MKYLLDGIESERLLFRKILPCDFDLWLPFFHDPASFEHWSPLVDKPERECRKWFVRQAERYENDEGGMNALIEKGSGSFIGFCGLLIQIIDGTREMEVGYSLLANGRNKGFATEAARKCMHFAFENDFTDSIISIISLTNSPSANVAIKNGMQIERQTIYRENMVNIFRVLKSEWMRRSSE
jgi:ribosomal-protein-alanine N-acetyltransferase